MSKYTKEVLQQDLAALDKQIANAQSNIRIWQDVRTRTEGALELLTLMEIEALEGAVAKVGQECLVPEQPIETAEVSDEG